MAVWQLLRATRRQWWVVAIGAVLTVIALLVVHSRPGLYQTQVQIAVHPPYPEISRNPYVGNARSLIATAGVLSAIAGQNSRSARTSSSVTLAGRGITDGYAVDLPNRGGQWTYDLDRPILDVQAVGRTRERAQANLDEAVRVITVALERLQVEADVPPRGRMTVAVAPEHPEIGYSTGRPSRALAVTGVLGVAGTLLLILLIDHRRSRWRPAPAVVPA